jgi:hypothetical protein
MNQRIIASQITPIQIKTLLLYEIKYVLITYEEINYDEYIDNLND